jgi:hypothetical protein
MADGFPPRCASKYALQGLLATGGYGSVFLATQIGLARPVVVKLLHGFVLADEEQVHRFINEARITASLCHPNIVVLIDFEQEDGVPWIVYEYVAGRSLRAILKDGPLLSREAAEAARQVCAALSEAHEHGILHRDIKPDNVLRSDAGEYKVADFGVAKWAADSTLRTRSGVILGTTYYLAPEVIRESGPTVQSDIYATGVTLFELLTGKIPFQADDQKRVITQRLRLPPPAPSSLRPTVPAALDAITRKALALSPDDRFQSAAEMQAALEEFLVRPARERSERPSGPEDPRRPLPESAPIARPPSAGLSDEPRCPRAARGRRRAVVLQHAASAAAAAAGIAAVVAVVMALRPASVPVDVGGPGPLAPRPAHFASAAAPAGPAGPLLAPAFAADLSRRLAGGRRAWRARTAEFYALHQMFFTPAPDVGSIKRSADRQTELLERELEAADQAIRAVTAASAAAAPAADPSGEIDVARLAARELALVGRARAEGAIRSLQIDRLRHLVAASGIVARKGNEMESLREMAAHIARFAFDARHLPRVSGFCAASLELLRRAGRPPHDTAEWVGAALEDAFLMAQQVTLYAWKGETQRRYERIRDRLRDDLAHLDGPGAPPLGHSALACWDLGRSGGVGANRELVERLKADFVALALALPVAAGPALAAAQETIHARLFGDIGLAQPRAADAAGPRRP